MAATLQARLEEVLFENLNALHARTRQKSLCLAGGVAFNCLANGKIFERTPFERVFVQPAAGDAGLAIGAAYLRASPGSRAAARLRDEALLLGPRLFRQPRFARLSSSSGLAGTWRGNRRTARRRTCAERRPSASPTADILGWFGAARSGDRARWEIAASWPIRAARK